MGKRKVVSGSMAIALGIVCMVLVACLVGVIVNDMAIIGEKDRMISSLNSQIASLNSQITSLQNQINSLNIERASLQNQVNDLKSEIKAKDFQISQLQIWLKSNGTLLINLQAQFNAYRSSYESLRDKVNERSGPANIESFITPQDRAIRDIVYAITGGWSNPSDFNEFWKDVKAMYNWVVENVEYRYDGLYPILPYDPSGKLYFWKDMWQFPNETLELRKGDCEDMAVLLCSMIRCYNGMKYWVECIIIESSKSAHVAVQIPVSGGKLVILDPAGKYYSHDLFGNIAFNDVATEINNWLNYWRKEMGSDVHVSRVFSDYMDKTFTSTDEYIAWMYSRG